MGTEKIYDVITQKEAVYDQMDMFKMMAVVSEPVSGYNASEE